MGPTWGPYGADRTQVGPTLAPWTLLSGMVVLSAMAVRVTCISYLSMVVCLRLYRNILSGVSYISRENCFFITIIQSVMWAKNRLNNDPKYIFGYYTISSSPLYEVFLKHWTCKMLVRYILSSVCLTSSLFSPSSCMPYMGLCVISWPISLSMIVRILYFHLIIIIKEGMWILVIVLGNAINNGTACISYCVPIEKFE